jgi:hypothetical protein
MEPQHKLGHNTLVSLATHTALQQTRLLVIGSEAGLEPQKFAGQRIK